MIGGAAEQGVAADELTKDATAATSELNAVFGRPWLGWT